MSSSSSLESSGSQIRFSVGAGKSARSPALLTAAAVLPMQSSNGPLIGASSWQYKAMVVQTFGLLEVIGRMSTVEMQRSFMMGV
ncbi:hypothetical protein KBZ19_00620 [Synechococcus sp. L2F]|uniref:hypothetical protein n=1 Tax=Synechococcus sp. L2F TaxID=2823739 RepID=UPI0020CE7C5E|nr:hypothetical protein [Synechococcus sp. L2F]MCP9826994.1 hypothetical protein [Synechococcus sp. L2F]